MSLTKQDLKEISGVLDKRLRETEAGFDENLIRYQGAIIEAVDFRFQKVEREISELRQELRNLAITLDNFVKMMTDYKDKFIILKAEVDQIKKVFKEKFGVEIAAQR